MAIAVDASSPAAKFPANGTTQASNAFSPPGSSLVVIMYGSPGAQTVSSITDNLSALTGMSKLIGFVENTDCNGEIWVADVPSSPPGSMTLTLTLSGAGAGGVFVAVLTGAQNAAAQVANANTNHNSSFGTTTLTSTLTMNGSASQMLGVFANRQGTNTAPTMGTGCTDVFGGNTFDGVPVGSTTNHAWAEILSLPAGAAGSTATISATYASNVEYVLSVAEILAGSGGGSPTFTGFIPSRMPIGV